jgi:hypothetical protein
MTQYHSLITAHGILAVLTFLVLVPLAIMIKRFRRSRTHETNTRIHAYLNILAVLFSTVVFILGFFAVGPSRSLTNPHHGIGVAIYVLILVQALGGRLIKNIHGHSLRVHLHRWFGRTIGLLGVVQIPLGLTLYGSPKFTFILYALWMAFLVLCWFVLSYRHDQYRDEYTRGARSEVTRTERKSSGGMMGWLGPLAAGAGAMALLKGRNKERSRSRSRSRGTRARSHSRVTSLSRHERVRSRSRAPEVIASRRGSDSYVDEKFEQRRRSSGGGGFMSKAMGVGAAVGAGALFSRFLGKRDKNRHDEEYSAVATDTPSRNRVRRHRPPPSEYSDDYTNTDIGRSSILPAPNPAAAAAALSAAEMRPGADRTRPPMTHPRSHPGRSGITESGLDASDYSSYYESPSRRPPQKRHSSGGAGKGVLAGLGLGWFAKKMKDRRDTREEERLRDEEADRRAGHRNSRYTADGYGSPSRRDSRRQRPVGRPVAPPSGITTVLSDESESMIEPRPLSGYGGPPMAPLPATGAVRPPPPTGYVPPQAPIPVTPGRHRSSRSQSRSRHDIASPVDMPSMPGDPRGVLHHESGSESYFSPGGQPHRRHSSRRRREADTAAAEAVATASRLAASEEDRRGGPSKPVGVKVKLHDDRDRNVTLRRITDDETLATRRAERRGRNGSVSSLTSASEVTPTRRYRRDAESSRGRAESEAEQRVDPHSDRDEPLAPPNPAFAAGRRPKDSAYYSQPGPAGGTPAAGATVSSLGSPGSHGTWSALSPSTQGPSKEPTGSAADRRRRRRLERRDGSRQPSVGTVEFS